MYLSRLQGPTPIKKQETENDLSVRYDRDGKPIIAGVEPKGINLAARMRSGYRPKPLPMEHVSMWDPGQTRVKDQYDHSEVRVEPRNTTPFYRNDERVEGTGIQLSKYPKTGGYHDTDARPDLRVPHERNSELGVPVVNAKVGSERAREGRFVMRGDESAEFRDVSVPIGDRVLERRDAEFEQKKEKEAVAPSLVPAVVGIRSNKIDSNYTILKADSVVRKHPTGPVSQGDPIHSRPTLRDDSSVPIEPANVASARQQGSNRPNDATDRRMALSLENQKMLQSALTKPSSFIGEYTLADAGLKIDHMTLPITAEPSHPSRFSEFTGSDDTSHMLATSTDRRYETTERHAPDVELTSDEGKDLPMNLQMPYVNAPNRSHVTLKDAMLPVRTPTELRITKKQGVQVPNVESKKRTVAGVMQPFLNFVKASVVRPQNVTSSKRHHTEGPLANVTGMQRPSEGGKVHIERTDESTPIPAQNVMSFMKSVFKGGAVETSKSGTEMPAPADVVEKGVEVQARYDESTKQMLSTRTTNQKVVSTNPLSSQPSQVELKAGGSEMRLPGGGMAMNIPVME